MPIVVLLRNYNLENFNKREALEEISTISKEIDFENKEAVLYLQKKIIGFGLNQVFGDGQVILKGVADQMMDNFNKSHVGYAITRSSINTFIDKIRDELTLVPPNFEKGIRFHIGKDSNGTYNIVAIPVCGPKRIAGRRDHSQDLEQTFFTNNHRPFFALNIATGDIVDEQTAIDLVSIKDTSVINPDPNNKAATKAIYFSATEFKKFCQQTVSSGDFTFYFSRTAANDTLSTVIVGGSSALVYFDQGDLIPPPPINDSSVSR